MGLYIKDESPYWHGSFKLPGQKQFKFSTKIPITLEGRVSAANKKLAQSVFEKTRADHLSQKHLNIPKKILLSELVELWISTKSKENCDVDSYRYILKTVLEYFKERFAQEITTEQIELYRVWRLEQKIVNKDGEFVRFISKSTVNREMAYLGAVYSTALRFKKLTENPIKQTDKKDWSEEELKRNRYFNFEEKTKILNSARRSTFAPLADIVAVDLITGMRRSEILNLRWSSVDLVRGILTIEKSKSGRKRHLGINKELSNILVSRCRDSDFVFTWNGEQIKKDTLTHAFIRCVRAAGVPNAHFHDLRHTFASDFASESKDMLRLQYLLGHASGAMTQRYAHFVHSEEVNAQLDKLPALPVYPVFIPGENEVNFHVA